MNEQRLRRDEYMQRVTKGNSLDAVWDEFRAVLSSLLRNPVVASRPDLCLQIIKLSRVVAQNKPNKKLAKSIEKKIADIKQSVNLVNTR